MLKQSRIHSFSTFVAFFFTCYLIQATTPAHHSFPPPFLCIIFYAFVTISLAEMSFPDTNRRVMLPFVVFLDTFEFKRKFNSLEPPVRDFLLWVENSAVPTAKGLMVKVGKRI